MQVLDKASERRQLDFISQITTKIIHISGEENEIADTLSLLDIINIPVVVSTDELYTEQQTDADLNCCWNPRQPLIEKNYVWMIVK